MYFRVIRGGCRRVLLLLREPENTHLRLTTKQLVHFILYYSVLRESTDFSARGGSKQNTYFGARCVHFIN